MKFDFVSSVAPLVVIVAAAAVALPTVTPMQLSTVLMMVLPSMIVFSIFAFALGMKHGEFRASR